MLKRIYLALSLGILLSAIASAQIGSLLSGGAGHGRSVLNPSADSTTAYNFINVMKTCTSLRSSGAAWGFPGGLNANGYPLPNLSIGISCGANSPSFSEYSGAWVIAWSGSLGATSPAANFSFRAGTLTVTTDCSPTCISSNAGSIVTLKGSNGYIIVQPSGPGSSCCSVNFLTGVSDTTVKDIAIYRKDQESWFGTASIAGTTLTVSTTTSGSIRKGDFVYSNGVEPGTRITAVLGGGLYTVSISQSLSIGRMSSAQTFNPDNISSIKALNPRILRVGLSFGTPNSQTQTRDAYTAQISSMLWNGGYYWPTGTWVGGQGAAGTISSGRAGALDCGAGAVAGVTYCAPLPTDSGPSVYVDGETVTGFVVNGASPFSLSVTGSISGTTLTTTAGTVDGLRGVTCTGCARGTIITGGSGTTWTVNISQTVSSQAMTLVPTLQIGNKPPIMISGSIAGSIGGSIGANTNRIFIYDDVLKVWLSSIGDVGQSIYNPVEIQAELCNVAGTDCWFQPPYMYDDASIATWSQKVAANLNGKAYVEWANEVYGGSFQADSVWAVNRGTALGFPDNYRDYYALQVVRFMKAIRAAWTGPDPTRVKAIETIFIGSPSFTRDLTDRVGGFDLLMDSNGFYTTGGGGSIQGYVTAGFTLNVTAINSGRVQKSMGISGNGIVAGVTIADFLSPLSGGGTGGSGSGALGSYTLSTNVGTVCSLASPCTWTLTAGGTGNPIVTDWTQSPNRPVDYAAAISTATYFRGANLVFGRSTDSGYVQFETATYAITAITQANPGVVTATGIGTAGKAFANGDRVQLTTVGGMTALNNAWATVSNLNAGANTFELSNITTTSQICCAQSGGVNQGALISAANPAVVTWAGSNLTAGTKIRFVPAPATSSAGPIGAMPSPVTADTDYYVLATGLGANSFQFSTAPGGTAVNTTGGTTTGVIGAYVVVANDTSALPAYTSGGVLKRIIPGVNDSLYSWADQYALGTALAQQAALTSVMQDVINGQRIGPNNVLSGAQLGTVDNFQTGVGSWNQFVPIVTYFPWLIFLQYEGAYDGATMSNFAATELGISGLYPNKIYNLYIAFRNSDQHRNVNNLMMQNFISFSGLNGIAPAMSGDFLSSSTNLWGMYPGTLYTPPLQTGQNWSKPFTNFDAFANFDAGLPFLLKRDLNPASNDNSPAFLNKAA